MLEVDCSILTPEPVLKASGHVDRFADLMVKDLTSGECHRLDHLIKATLEKALKDKATEAAKKDRATHVLSTLDGMTKDEMADLMKEWNIVSPTTGNPLSEPLEFNLMFSTSIGPTGLVKGFLRPETAQGIFVNFKRLLEFSQGKLPFAAAQIGNAFRNEISPRSGLLRVREFTMAEIEHFCDPTILTHPKFESVSKTVMTLFSACDQMDGKKPSRLAIGDAVKTGLVANETLGYFLTRIQEFLINTGVNPEKLRFRQHMGNEMAHYARDCWDAECLTSYGWVECVGCADRSAYDLKQHTKATGVKLTAERKLATPKTVSFVQPVLNKATLGKVFKKDAKLISDYFAGLEEPELETIESQLKANGFAEVKIGESTFKLNASELSISRGEKTIHVEEFVPNVIEPSFGIGRILYSIFEHNFKVRPEDTQRSYLSLPTVIAPVKCSVLPLSNKPEFNAGVIGVLQELRKYDISVKVDDSSGSIGRRYARTDEIAIPFGITIDFETLKNATVTLRERDSTLQVRLPIDKVGLTLRELSLGTQTWESVMSVYPKFEAQDLS
jgi:glycyl-tRNA synthetase